MNESEELIELFTKLFKSYGISDVNIESGNINVNFVINVKLKRNPSMKYIIKILGIFREIEDMSTDFKYDMELYSPYLILYLSKIK